jgi:hypothetical protein
MAGKSVGQLSWLFDLVSINQSYCRSRLNSIVSDNFQSLVVFETLAGICREHLCITAHSL